MAEDYTPRISRAADMRQVARSHGDRRWRSKVVNAIHHAAHDGETECDVSLRECPPAEFAEVTAALQEAGYTVAQHGGDRRRVTVYW